MSERRKRIRTVALMDIYRRYDADVKFRALREHAGPKRIVTGRGSLDPRAVFVGEAPGRMEQATRKPFQGPAGSVLDQLLAVVGLTRRDIWLTNVVKFRPTIGVNTVRNRTPNPGEQIASWPYAWQEIDVFPEVPVVCLGGVPLACFGPPGVKVSMWHGVSWNDPKHRFTSWFHPAYAVYNPDNLPILMADAERFREEVLD